MRKFIFFKDAGYIIKDSITVKIITKNKLKMKWNKKYLVLDNPMLIINP